VAAAGWALRRAGAASWGAPEGAPKGRADRCWRRGEGAASVPWPQGSLRQSGHPLCHLRRASGCVCELQSQERRGDIEMGKGQVGEGTRFSFCLCFSPDLTQMAIN